uniref:N-myc and STAT interactor n=1 Tax=Lepisosteus oculatus TaxID=7918 RepID=W5M0D0_LEPOC
MDTSLPNGRNNFRDETLSPEDQAQLEALLEELDKWKQKHERADTEKSRLLLEKLDTEEQKKAAQSETMELLAQLKHGSDAFQNNRRAMEQELQKLEKSNGALKEKLLEQEEMLKIKRSEHARLKQQFKAKIKASIPEKSFKFTGQAEEGDNLHIEGKFTIIRKPLFLLSGGQALITFEEEKVASRILKLAKCHVEFDNSKMDVKPLCVTMDPSVKFELHIRVSKRKVRVSNIPPVVPEETMRDKLEISFSKLSKGGGEVESVDYNGRSGTGLLTFLNGGVAEHLALKKKHTVDTGVKVLESRVQPCFEYELKKLQTFCGVSRRTVLLSGLRDELEEEDLQDNLEIHFQKPSNYGGEVESIKYVRQGRSLEAYFVEDTAEAE